MSDIESIETAILSISHNDFEKLKNWLFNLDYERWEQQIERDFVEGKLEDLATEAFAKRLHGRIAEFKAGHCREI